MFCFFDCCLTELYSYLYKLFCAIILDIVAMVNKLLILIPYGVFKTDFQTIRCWPIMEAFFYEFFVS